jgi:hypothetical protein
MLPLHLQPQSHVPLYVQLRDQLRALVHAGDLRPGDRIPASRELATMLGVHRTTVANAYAELESEGLIQGHVGRGTFIKGNGNGLKITPPAPPVLNGNEGVRWELLFADERGEEVLSRLTASAPEDALSFVMARPAQEFFPIEELQMCVNAVLRREGADVLNLGPSDGYPPLKEALLEMLHRDGIAAKDENLLITDGCQQSFDLISKAFVRPGDSVIMENPTYPGAVAIFHGARARCLSVPMRTQAEPGVPLGLDLEALEATLAANRVKLILLTPDFQNPTGTSHLRPAECPRGTNSLAKAARPFKHRHSNRQLCEGGVPGIARRMDRCSSGGHRAVAHRQADDGLAHGPTRASNTRGVLAARPVQQASCENAQGLHFAAGSIRRGTAKEYAGRHAVDAAGRRHVSVAGTSAGV